MFRRLQRIYQQVINSLSINNEENVVQLADFCYGAFFALPIDRIAGKVGHGGLSWQQVPFALCKRHQRTLVIASGKRETKELRDVVTATALWAVAFFEA